MGTARDLRKGKGWDRPVSTCGRGPDPRSRCQIAERAQARRAGRRLYRRLIAQNACPRAESCPIVLVILSVEVVFIEGVLIEGVREGGPRKAFIDDQKRVIAGGIERLFGGLDLAPEQP